MATCTIGKVELSLVQEGCDGAISGAKHPHSNTTVRRMRDSTGLHRARDVEALQQRLNEDGYLYLKGVIPKSVISDARELVKSHLVGANWADGEHEIEAGKTSIYVSKDVSDDFNSQAQGKLPGGDAIVNSDVIRAAVDCKQLRELFELLFDGANVKTFNNKWLRGVKKGEFTGVHCDSVYMGRGTDQLLTCWIPFMDIPVELGGLCVIPKSHTSQGYSKLRETYGRMDVDADDIRGTGWITEDPLEALRLGELSDGSSSGVGFDKSLGSGNGSEGDRTTYTHNWATTDYEQGDIVVFTLHTLHASTTNTTDQWRLSCDTRWQPSSSPSDPRWCEVDGDPPSGHTKFTDENRWNPKVYPITLEEAKREWGLYVH